MSKMSITVGALAGGLALTFSGAALAQSEASAQTEGHPSGAHAAAEPPRRVWLEAGVFGGLLFPSDLHSVYRTTQQPFASPVPELGARLALFPSRYFGLEAEALAGPARTAGSDEAAGIWAARGHGLLQLPLGAVTPFALAGFGALGAGSNATGSDTDEAVHLGLGAKLALDELVGLRLDLRDVISAKYSPDQSDNVHNPELLLGLTFSLDFSKKAAAPAAPPPDADADGVPDVDDECRRLPGPAPLGCPVPKDSDGDGFIDDKDACPTEAGAGKMGCPDRDPDRDCVDQAVDRCPSEAGAQPDGCPERDVDRDGIPTPEDRCPAEPETKNGFQDQDGCPDTLPEQVKRFSGVIPGIEFELGKATIRPSSGPTLDEAANVLKQYPALRVTIAGHTDNVGARDKNVALSLARAEAVKAYLVGRGIAAERLQTRGAGPDEPIAGNEQAAGRQKNRRIELKLMEK